MYTLRFIRLSWLFQVFALVGAFSASMGAHSQSPNHQVLDLNSVESLPVGGGKQYVVLDLNFIRLEPSVLLDTQFLNYFIGINNCGNKDIVRQMSSEFDYPEIAKFYQQNAGSILRNIPTTLTFRVQVELGSYDFSQSAFPIHAAGKSDLTVDHFDPVVGPRSYCGSSNAPALNGKSVLYRIEIRPFELKFLPMEPATAKAYIDDPRIAAHRLAYVNFDVQIVQQKPKLLRQTSGAMAFNAYTFEGIITKANITNTPFSDAKVLATLNSFDKLPPEQQAPETSMSSKPASGQVANQAHPEGSLDSSQRVFAEYIASCEGGDAKGCQMAGYCYHHGSGVGKDLQLAKQFYDKACAMGRQQACRESKWLQAKGQ